MELSQIERRYPFLGVDLEYYLRHRCPLTPSDGEPDLRQQLSCVVRACRRTMVGGGGLTPRSTGEASMLPPTYRPFSGRYWHSLCSAMGHEKRLTLCEPPPSAWMRRRPLVLSRGPRT